MVDELFERAGDEQVVLRVHVQPGAGRSAVVGRHGEAVKLRVAAPPEGGRANRAAQAALAEAFGLSPAQVTLESGTASRAKRFRLSGVDVDGFGRLLERVLESGSAGTGPRARPRPGPGRR